MNIHSDLRRLSVCLGLALGATAPPLHARIVKVYTPDDDGSAFEFMRELAASLKGLPGPVVGTEGGFGFMVSDAEALGAEFSVAPGVSAYFWSDRGYVWGSDFIVDGKSTLFEYGPAPLGKEGLVAQEAPRVFATSLGSVSMDPTSLRLSYALSKPGSVTVELFEASGKMSGRWTWHESSPGKLEKTLSISTEKGGVRFMRWKAGGMSATRRITMLGNAIPR